MAIIYNIPCILFVCKERATTYVNIRKTLKKRLVKQDAVNTILFAKTHT